MTKSIHPRIYVACLAAYNSGRLHGAWIDAAQSPAEIHEEVQNMLASSPIPQAEEWAIHDFEGFSGIQLSEYADLDEVSRVAALLAKHGAAFGAFASNVGLEHAASDGFEEAYCGEWESESAYAEQLFDELYLHDVPDNTQQYIDYEKFARDLFMSDYYSEKAPQGVFVFRHA